MNEYKLSEWINEWVIGSVDEYYLAKNGWFKKNGNLEIMSQQKYINML